MTISSLRVNHLIIGAPPSVAVEEVTEFYQQLLGFAALGDFVDSRSSLKGKIVGFGPAGRFDKEVLVPGFHILVIPMETERLPNPQHFALEVSPTDFDHLWQRVQQMHLPVRSLPSLVAPPSQVPGTLEMGPYSYRLFYVVDPAGVNLEINSRTDTP